MICLPKELAVSLKQAATRGEITMEKIFNAKDSATRRKLFEKYVGTEGAKFVNTGFEKAIGSGQQANLEKWITKTFKGTQKEGKTILDSLSKVEGLLDTNTLDDAVREALGVYVNPEQLKTIETMAGEVAKAQEKLGGIDKFYLDGTDAQFQKLMGFLEANKKLDDYVSDLNPSKPVKTLISTIGRGNMLISPKSILVNIENNTVGGALEWLNRRIASGQVTGSNPELIVKFVKQANKIYDKTGYDVVRLLNDGLGAYQGEQVKKTTRKGTIGAIAGFYEDTIYKWGLGKPDIVSASYAFADSADITSTAMAKKLGLSGDALKKKAAEIFTDATSPTPKTLEGEVVRLQAIKDATEATYTNDGMLSTLVMEGLRKPLNAIYDGLGEFVVPFAKTPANVVELAADYGGVGAVKAIAKTVVPILRGEKLSEAAIRSATKDAVRAGVGFTTATVLASLINPDDYMGEYPTSAKEKALLDAKNATTNSIRVGDKWISLDYFGVLAAGMTGILRAKKYGKQGDYLKNAEQYATGIIQQYSRVPGVEEVISGAEWAKKKLNEPFSDDLNEMTNNIINSLIDSVPPRLIPALISDFTKLTPNQKQVDYDKPVQMIQSRVPFWNASLPDKTTVLGETKKNEPITSQLLFGARVKTAITTDVTEELTRLQRAGQLPAVGNPAYSSTRFKELKEQLGGDDFLEAMEWYGQELDKKFAEEIKKESYKTKTEYKGGKAKKIDVPDEDKKKKLDKIKQDIMDRTIAKFKPKK